MTLAQLPALARQGDSEHRRHQLVRVTETVGSCFAATRLTARGHAHATNPTGRTDQAARTDQTHQADLIRPEHL